MFAADGTRLARVDVTHHTTAAALAAALDDARHGLGAKPGPADLGGTSWYTAKDSTVGVTLGVGEYEILVGIYAKPAKGTPPRPPSPWPATPPRTTPGRRLPLDGTAGAEHAGGGEEGELVSAPQGDVTAASRP